jgi:hypothetical protein
MKKIRFSMVGEADFFAVICWTGSVLLPEIPD